MHDKIKPAALAVAVVVFYYSGGLLPAIIAYGFVSIVGKMVLNASQTGDPQSSEWEQKWNAVGDALGVEARARTSKNNESSLRGTVNGYRVTAYSHVNGNPEIEVDFDTGFRSLKIRKRRPNTVQSAPEILTGDPLFDEAFRLRKSHTESDEELLSWLTPTRRTAILALEEALDFVEIEEDELEVRLGTKDWEAEHLVEAIALCVMVAGALDKSAALTTPQDVIDTPQDIVRDAPQDRLKE